MGSQLVNPRSSLHSRCGSPWLGSECKERVKLLATWTGLDRADTHFTLQHCPKPTDHTAIRPCPAPTSPPPPDTHRWA